MIPVENDERDRGSRDRRIGLRVMPAHGAKKGR